MGIIGLLAAFWAGGTTFSHDVAPILYRQCVSCHRPGGVAPFSLIAYQDAAKRAKLIAAVTSKRAMPPWLPSEPHFRNERRLTIVRRAGGHENDLVELQLIEGGACHRQMRVVNRVERATEDADSRRQLRTSPWPSTTNFCVVRPSSPTGPRACSLLVEMPISAPRPNS